VPHQTNFVARPISNVLFCFIVLGSRRFFGTTHLSRENRGNKKRQLPGNWRKPGKIWTHDLLLHCLLSLSDTIRNSLLWLRAAKIRSLRITCTNSPSRGMRLSRTGFPIRKEPQTGGLSGGETQEQSDGTINSPFDSAAGQCGSGKATLGRAD
jgi:hypothetical protein